MNKYFMDSDIIEHDMQDIYSRNLEWRKLQGKTVLITGATGMLASYVVFFLVYLNERYGLDMHFVLMVRNLQKCRQRFGIYVDKAYVHVITSDINQPLTYDKKVDFIIHAASLASPQYYGKMPVEVAAPNVIGTYYLLKFAQEQNVSSFLFFSSGDIYGEMPVGMGNITEDMGGVMDPLAVHSCYGESKRMGETWCAAFAREHHVPVSIVRIGHTYGPTMDVENDPRVFAAFMKCIYHGQDITMLSDGTAKRPFCYIADAVAAFMLILLRGERGAAYNMCNSAEFLSMSELAAIMINLRPELELKIIKKQRASNVEYVENTGNKANKPIETKLKSLGWECHYDSRRGFRNVLDYLLANKV